MNVNKRGFFSWLFFQDPDKVKGKGNATYVHDSVTAPAQDRWLRLTIIMNGAARSMEMRAFPINIGRMDSYGGIKIDDKNVCKQHAVINLQDGILTITDNNSKNGVRVGGNKIVPNITTPLACADSVQIGYAEIVIDDFSGSLSSFGIDSTAFPDSVGYAPQKPQVDIPQESVAAANPANNTCSGCGNTNNPESKFCKGCGKPMGIVAPAPAPVKPFCDKCGAKNVNMANFCAGCGNNLQQ
ncbi:MAG: zinc ribbon domain-containing protein [Defluviitaleaceae bacterium]|nr:zinc ribbon domain-containing protein [Defluviitaleaceae bacterium]